MSGAFSHSRLSLLDDCPRRYSYRYVEKVPEAFQTADAFMGTMVHDTLQWLYTEREARREPSEAEVLARFRDEWNRRLAPSVRVVQDHMSLERFRDDGESMLSRHYRGAFAEDRLETLAVEPKISIDVRPEGGELATYVGFIDRLARDAEGMLHVIDYKTGKRMPRDMDEAGLQVRGYGLGVLEKHGGAEVALRYEYLRHGRNLSETFPRARGVEVASAIAQRVQRALAVEAAADFPPRPSMLCRWCGYREICEGSPFRVTTPQAPAGARPAAPPPSPWPLPAGEACPLCGSGLRLRVSTRSELVACERYPDCKHARDATPMDRARLAPPRKPPQGKSA